MKKGNFYLVLLLLIQTCVKCNVAVDSSSTITTTTTPTTTTPTSTITTTEYTSSNTTESSTIKSSTQISTITTTEDTPSDTTGSSTIKSTTDISTNTTTEDTSSDTTGSSTTTTTTVTTTTTPTTTTTVTTTTTTTTVPPTTTPAPQSLNQHSFTWDKSDSSFESEIVLQVDEGCSIAATISDFNLNGGNYVIISDPLTTNGRIFANQLNDVKSYLFETTLIVAKYVFEDNSGSGEEEELKILFERVGEPLTTVSTVSTTTVSLPTTEEGEGDDIYTTISVSGYTLSDFQDENIEGKFKNCIVEIAEEYIKAEHVTITQSITTSYVIIAKINQCPYSWPNSETCIQIKFKLPIFHDGAKWNGYQMKTDHLNTMWSRYSNRCKEFSPYKNPDVDNIIMWWVIGIVVVIAAFIVLLWFLRNMSSRVSSAMFRRNRRRRSRRWSDTMSIVSSTHSQRLSKLSLEPHYLQDTPKFFENN